MDDSWQPSTCPISWLFEASTMRSHPLRHILISKPGANWLFNQRCEDLFADCYTWWRKKAASKESPRYFDLDSNTDDYLRLPQIPWLSSTIWRARNSCYPRVCQFYEDAGECVNEYETLCVLLSVIVSAAHNLPQGSALEPSLLFWLVPY